MKKSILFTAILLTVFASCDKEMQEPCSKSKEQSELQKSLKSKLIMKNHRKQ